MNLKRQVEVRNAATQLQRLLWEQRKQIWQNPPDQCGILPIPLEVIVRSVLGLNLEEPEEIRLTNSNDSYEVAGFLNRPEGRIAISQKFQLEWRRFTLAHEIAHWILHPGEAYHRDRPLTGGERADMTRTLIEQEADMFAGELLMPEKPLRHRFQQIFGGRYDGRTGNAAAQFTAATRQEIGEIQFSANLRYRALIIARTESFKGRYFVSLAKVFGVSPTAMAIQLELLGLVV